MSNTFDDLRYETEVLSLDEMYRFSQTVRALIRQFVKNIGFRKNTRFYYNKITSTHFSCSLIIEWADLKRQKRKMDKTGFYDEAMSNIHNLIILEYIKLNGVESFFETSKSELINLKWDSILPEINKQLNNL